ncbi:hypothetical protein [Vibrio japonicus]|uniref:Lipoprotein n=1 Tax=Vibrio japonicus TaxID=1824638 RepID=A0ABY5LGV4_9VIBR|nr:hypothetical protein [Vibrio japonicus]UUM30038.1 hypothetical protein NP165_10005 [Vibrio japonicus]
MLRALVCCGLVVSLTACSSSPRHVEAQVPLVKEQFESIGSKLSAKYRAQLENAQQRVLFHQEYQVELGGFYISSLGQDCRNLIIQNIDGVKSQRVACAEPKQYPEQIRTWYLIPNIIQSASPIQL